MAKVKEAMNGGVARDVENDLLGVTKPRGAKALAKAAAAAKTTPKKMAQKVAEKEVKERAPRTPKALFEDNQRIKKVGERNTRPDSNVGKVIGLLKPNMTFGEFSKALDKSKLPFKASNILGFLQRDGVIQVK